MIFRSAAASDVGCVRAVNEDAFLDRPDRQLWAVADGMGGGLMGDLASRVVVEALGAAVLGRSLDERSRAVEEALHASQQRLSREGHKHGPGAIVATTILVLLAVDDHSRCIWAGDSRLYRLRRGRLDRLSHDHSYVQELVDAAMLPERDAEHHPQANIVTRAVGAHETLVLESRDDAIEPEDRLLLCTDGLFRMVAEPEIAACLDRAEMAVSVRELMDLCLERGAIDNVTLVAVRALSGKNGPGSVCK